MAGSFSFDTPEEVMHVLASVRASGIDTRHKNQLRDLILSYTNGGKDPSLKIQIEQQLNQLGIAPNAQPTTLSTKEPLSFGSSRNVPSFAVAPSAQPAPTAQPVPPPVTPMPPAQPQTPVAAPVTAPPQPTPVAAPVPPPVQPVAPAAPPPAPVAPVAAPQPSVSSSPDPLQRIREIKALVNEKVGNPVNLVDIDNTVGREYMAALLDAMKKLNSGGDVTGAMQRLESAYTAVEQVLQNRPTTDQQPVNQATPAVAPAPTAPVPGTINTESSERDDSDSVSIPIQSSARIVRATDSPDDSAARWANNTIRVPDSVAPIRELEPEPPARVIDPVADVVRPTPITPLTPEPITAPEPEPEPEPYVAPVVEPPQPLAPPPKPKPVIKATPPPTPSIDLAPPNATADAMPGPIKPLSKTGEPLKSVNDLPAPDSLETSSKAGDPLFTREVDDGLNQLLTDWILFKKSGLFGTGPKGVQHPLFQKIKDLQIPILLAGRFDGATQEIKQSITDYMNGWRYEQGIIYEQGETFEHYLRRVIRHILDLQK